MGTLKSLLWHIDNYVLYRLASATIRIFNDNVPMLRKCPSIYNCYMKDFLRVQIVVTLVNLHQASVLSARFRNAFIS